MENNGCTPLMYMAMKEKTAAALGFIKNPIVDISIKSNVGWTAAMYAIAFKQPQLAKALLPLMGTDTDDADIEGSTMLHYACLYGQVEIVKLLIEKKQIKENQIEENQIEENQIEGNPGSVNRANNAGETPLMMAVKASNLVIVKLLLAAGADIDAKTLEGQSPLMYAAVEGKSDFAQMLVLENADVNAVDNLQGSALSYAIQAELPQTVELLLEAGAEN